MTQLFYQPLLPEGILFLDGEESRHAIKVLRLQVQDLLQVTDGQGWFYKVRIINADPKKCAFEILEKVKTPGNNYRIHLAVAPTKNNDRLEWLIEKVVELGIDEISFILCEHSERRKINLERLEKKAVSAMKQSLKAYLPRLNPELKLKDFINNSAESAQKFIAYVDQTIPEHLQSAAKPGQKYCILIGPEGDFSPAEIEMAIKNDYQPASLGKSRLRTETAGMVACHILNLINE